MRRVNWTITEQQHRELKRLSKETGMPISELVRRALDNYFMAINQANEEAKSSNPTHLPNLNKESEVLP